MTAVDVIGGEDGTYSGTYEGACPLVRKACSTSFGPGAGFVLPASTALFRNGANSWSWLAWFALETLANPLIFNFEERTPVGPFPSNAVRYAASWQVGLVGLLLTSTWGSFYRPGAVGPNDGGSATVTHTFASDEVGVGVPHLIGISYDSGAEEVETILDGVSLSVDPSGPAATFTNFPAGTGWDDLGDQGLASFAAGPASDPTRLGQFVFFENVILGAADHASLYAARYSEADHAALLGSLGATNHWPLDENTPCPCGPGWTVNRVGMSRYR